MENLQEKKQFFELLNERQKRLYAAMEAQRLGRSGVRLVSEAFGLHPHTLRKGIVEVASLPDSELDSSQIRKAGGGRKKR